MARFQYTAQDRTGKTYQGNSEARNEQELREKLKAIGLYVTSVKRERAVFRLGLKRVATPDLVIFSRQFATLMNAGLPLVTSLRAIGKQMDNPELKKVLDTIRMDIESGTALSGAMAKHPKVFSEFFAFMIHSGETAGILNKVLERLANHLEKEDNLKRTIRGAFAYPTIVGAFAIVVVIFLLVFIVPMFSKIYMRLNLNLPLPTLMLMGMSAIIRRLWWLFVIVGIAAVYFIRSLNKRPAFQEKIDNIKMALPLFGKLIRQATVARFVRTFGDMITSGISITEALRVADKVAANKVISRIVAAMNDNVIQGRLVSVALENQDVFPSVAVQLIASGEESGTLGFMLDKAADGLERDVDDVVKRLVVKIEPALTFLLACLVGFIAIAIYLPMFDVIAGIGK